MCCSAEPAKLSNTILFGAETEIDGVYHHVLGYQNRAENLSKNPNCMILAIPAKNELGPQSVIDTRGFKDILKLYAELFPNHARTRGLTKGVTLCSDDSYSVQVFDSGSYTVVLSKNLDLIEKALAQVDEKKRPTISSDLLNGLKKMYPADWQYVFCCFDGTIDAEPLVWIYQPLNPIQIFMPALDAHDGKAPDLNAHIKMDHTIAVASHRVEESKRNRKVDFYRKQDVPSEHRNLFPPAFAGATYQGTSPVNGDFWFPVSNFDNDSFSLTRATPPLSTPVKMKGMYLQQTGQRVTTKPADAVKTVGAITFDASDRDADVSDLGKDQDRSDR
jgi:hypothetical protein